MPQTPPADPDTRLVRVPVGVLLPPSQPGSPFRPAVSRRLPPWHGLDPSLVARLVATYSRPGDVVLDLDAHPTVASAARYLGRRPATTCQARRARRSGGDGPLTGTSSVGLIVWTPRWSERDQLADLSARTAAIARLAGLLRPGGFLLVAVPPMPGQRSLLITAARAAGLRYQQHLLAVRVALPEHEPRTAPSATAGRVLARLRGGRHIPVHTHLLAFASGLETTNACR